MPKYIIVSGGVISGLGKGIFTASLSKILQSHGLSVVPIKIDGYVWLLLVEFPGKRFQLHSKNVLG